MKSGKRWGAVLVTLVLLSGCAGTRSEVAPTTICKRPLPARVEGVVFCADGAGGYGGTTAALQVALEAMDTPLLLEKVEWSHGRGLVLADHLHHRNIVEQGQRLAGQVRDFRALHPDLPVYLVGYSAGCAVILAAAEGLGAGSVERIVLLAPSVSAGYDMRQALTTARQGVHAFISRRDWVVLGLDMWLSGTTDRRLAPAAGRVGFKPVLTCPQDEALYARLYQHPWEPAQAKSGHPGGHFGSSEQGYLRSFVVPLLTKGGLATLDRPIAAVSSRP